MKTKSTDKSDDGDLANWTALRMREMHKPIKEGLFMAGGLTPHQYLTKEVEALLTSQDIDSRIDELENATIASPQYFQARLAELKAMPTTNDYEVKEDG